MASHIKQHYDIIINGGGIVGFTLLNALAKSPHLNRLKVLLIEQSQRPASFKQPSRFTEQAQNSAINEAGQNDGLATKSFSNRVSSITPTSKSAIKNLGAWDSVKDFAKDVQLIKVWNYDYAHRIVFEPHRDGSFPGKDQGNSVFSVVENNRLSLALLESIHKRASDGKIVWAHALEELSCSSLDNKVELVVKDVKSDKRLEMTASLLLGCDGFKSKVRDLTGMTYREFKLDKSALVGTARLDLDDGDKNKVAYQKFSAEKDTVIALLPLDSEYSSFVISAPDSYAKYLMERDEDEFVIEVNRLLSTSEAPENTLLRAAHELTNAGFESIHEAIKLIAARLAPQSLNDQSAQFETAPRLDLLVEDSRACFPLIFGTTTPKMITPVKGVALLGDASHRVHPLAGQGLNLGIQDALELVRQLEKSISYGENVFSDSDALDSILKNYERKRQSYIVPMLGGIYSMPYIFKAAPSRALSIFDRCNPIKSTLVKFANG